MFQENSNHLTHLAVISVVEHVSIMFSVGVSDVAELKLVPYRAGRDDESTIAN